MLSEETGLSQEAVWDILNNDENQIPEFLQGPYNKYLQLKNKYAMMSSETRKNFPRYVGSAILGLFAIVFFSYWIGFMEAAKEDHFHQEHFQIMQFVRQWNQKYFPSAEKISIIAGTPKIETDSLGKHVDTLRHEVTLKHRKRVSSPSIS